MDIKLELTDRGLEVHISMEFDAKFPERGCCTGTLVRDILRQNGITVQECLVNPLVNFKNQSDTWVFLPTPEALKQVKESDLECKDTRSKKASVTPKKPVIEKALQEEVSSVPFKKRTKKKTVTEEK